MSKGSSNYQRPALQVFPADYFNKSAADQHFSKEMQAAEELGIQTMLFQDQELRQGNMVKSLGVTSRGMAIYRGWMMSAAEYRAFYQGLLEKGTELLTTPEDYQKAHEFPGWYKYFEAFTPRSSWCEETKFLEALSLHQGPVIIKDYVKSMKAYWSEACYIPEAKDFDQAIKVFKRFKELRQDIQGGIVIRDYEELGTELRSWWRGDRCVLVTPHPDTPNTPLQELPLDQVKDSVRELDCPFVTVDFAKRSDGIWRVVEVGDGQVSDRPKTVGAREFIKAISLI